MTSSRKRRHDDVIMTSSGKYYGQRNPYDILYYHAKLRPSGGRNLLASYGVGVNITNDRVGTPLHE